MGKPVPGRARTLIERLLDTPHAAQLIPRLQPEVLHRIVLAHGLEDSGDLIALASPAQLQRVFDFDLWHAAPGNDERLDADRFGVWLEVLMEAGPAVAAEKLLGMDQDFVAAALSQHVRVFDAATVSAYTTLDGEMITPRQPSPDALNADVGGFRVIARRTSADSVVPFLQYLDAEHPDAFVRLMSICRAQSDAGCEPDVLHDLLIAGDQHVFDVALDRAQRLEQQGYATPAQAHAFLQSARHVDLAAATPPARSSIANAYFHDVTEAATITLDAADDAADLAAGVAAVNELVWDAGVVSPARALLAAPEGESRLTRMQVFLRAVSERDAGAASMRLAELAFLTNAMVAGCPVQGRPFTVREAADAVVAICNLGLENWPTQWSVDDLLSVFQVGWATLHREVAMPTAQALVAILSGLRSRDRDIEFGLHNLRTSLTRHLLNGEPWHARGALEVVAMLDLPTSVALTSLIDECPTLHAAVAALLDTRIRAIDPLAFEFISENAHIATIRRFIEKLPVLMSLT